FLAGTAERIHPIGKTHPAPGREFRNRVKRCSKAPGDCQQHLHWSARERHPFSVQRLSRNQEPTASFALEGSTFDFNFDTSIHNGRSQSKSQLCSTCAPQDDLNVAKDLLTEPTPEFPKFKYSAPLSQAHWIPASITAVAG